MLALGQRHDAVEGQACRATPDDDVAMLERDPLRTIRSLLTAEQEYGRQTQRHRDDGRTVVAFVAVLVEGQARTGNVAIDEAGVRSETLEARRLRRPGRHIPEHRRHSGPRLPALRIGALVAIAGAVRDPPRLAAIGHGNGHS